jgi:hypothetical protein
MVSTWKHKEPYLQSDQFYVQLLQAMWEPIIQVDGKRKVFGTFAGGFPTRNADGTWTHNGTMDCTEAGIWHSPWLFPRTKAGDLTVVDRWTAWATEQRII